MANMMLNGNSSACSCAPRVTGPKQRAHRRLGQLWRKPIDRRIDFIFGHIALRRCREIYSFTDRSRKALVTTLMLLKAIAPAARMGLSCRRKSGAQLKGVLVAYHVVHQWSQSAAWTIHYWRSQMPQALKLARKPFPRYR